MIVAQVGPAVAPPSTVQNPPGIVSDSSQVPLPATGEETMRDAARRHLIEIDSVPFRDGAPLTIGDVVLIRVKERGPAKHSAITSGPVMIIHAYDRHAVAECTLPDAWRRRIAYAFQFPGVVD